MKPVGKLIIIGGGIDTGSFTEKDFTEQIDNNLNCFKIPCSKKFKLLSIF